MGRTRIAYKKAQSAENVKVELCVSTMSNPPVTLNIHCVILCVCLVWVSVGMLCFSWEMLGLLMLSLHGLGFMCSMLDDCFVFIEVRLRSGCTCAFGARMKARAD